MEQIEIMDIYIPTIIISQLLFLFLCIPSRLGLTYLLYKYPDTRLLGIIPLTIGIGFLYLYITNSRLTGSEVFGKSIWWAKYRIVHAVLYMTAGILFLLKNEEAWLFLLIDTLFGLAIFFKNTYDTNFS